MKRTLLLIAFAATILSLRASDVIKGLIDGNLTTEYLIEASDFTRSAGGSYRFGKPANWTVENFNIPNGGNGTKQGLDNYSGRDALMLGVWDDAGNNTEGDLSNARIYRRITLPAGKYYFCAAYNTTYNISEKAYMFVSRELYDTDNIPSQSIAYYSIKNCPGNKELQSLYFQLNEETEVYIGFQADLLNGSSTQEFRAESVALYTTKWEKLSALPTSLSDYYFTIVDNTDDLMLTLLRGNKNGNAYNSLYYKTSENPLIDKSMLFTLETDAGYQVMTNVEYSEYFIHTEWKPSEGGTGNRRYRTNSAAKEWGHVTFEYIEGGKWTIQNGKYTEGYLGPWDNAIANGAELAADKSGESVGNFQIYAISKTDVQAYWDAIAAGTGASIESPVDMTALIVNPNARSWDGSKPYGWTTTYYIGGGNGYDQFPGIFEIAGGSVAGSLRQTIGVPNGRYRLKAALMASDGVTVHLMANSDVSNNLVPIGDTGGNILPDGTETDMGSGQRGFKYLTVETVVTNGELEIGVDATSGSGWQWVDVDNFTLEYLGWSFPVAFGASGFGTFACPQKLALPEDESVKAYTATVSGTSVTFNKLTGCIPANTGVLVSGTANSTANLYVTDEDADAVENDFVVGTGTTFTGDANTYYFAVSKNAVELTFGTFNPSSVAIATNKAYLPIDKGAFTPGARLSLSFEDEETAISFIEAEDTEAPVKKDGKYLEDGKIVIVKNGVKYSANGQKLN